QAAANAQGVRRLPRHAARQERTPIRLGRMSARRRRGAADGDSLDPVDWDVLKRTFQDAVEQAIDHLRTVRDQPVWRQTPEEVKRRLTAALPRNPEPLDALLSVFAQDMLPFATGNVHPRFFGWVHGSGNPAGALGEM